MIIAVKFSNLNNWNFRRSLKNFRASAGFELVYCDAKFTVMIILHFHLQVI